MDYSKDDGEAVSQFRERLVELQRGFEARFPRLASVRIEVTAHAGQDLLLAVVKAGGTDRSVAGVRWSTLGATDDPARVVVLGLAGGSPCAS